MTSDQKDRIWNYLTHRNNMVFGEKIPGRTCPIALKKKGMPLIGVSDLHHRCPNTQVNRECFPLFIDSMLNLIPVNNGWHLQWPSFASIVPFKAKKINDFLSRHPKICDFVNGNTERLW